MVFLASSVSLRWISSYLHSRQAVSNLSSVCGSYFGNSSGHKCLCTDRDEERFMSLLVYSKRTTVVKVPLKNNGTEVLASKVNLPYSRVVTPPLLKRNFALKRGGGRNNENCIYLCVVTPPLPTQQYRCHSPVPHVRSLPQGNKRTHLAKITT